MELGDAIAAGAAPRPCLVWGAGWPGYMYLQYVYLGIPTNVQRWPGYTYKCTTMTWVDVQNLQPGLYIRTNVQTLRHDDRRPPRHAPRIRRNCLKPLIMHSAAMLSATEHVCWEMFPRHGFHHRDMTCDPACVAEAHNYTNWVRESAYTRQVEDMIKVCMNLNSICMSNAGANCEHCTDIMSWDTQDFAIVIIA